ncbi:hypothetical protein SFRURICE_002472, partial [Spodoptera frugiperda]
WSITDQCKRDGAIRNVRQSIFLFSTKLLRYIKGLSLLLQLCQNGRSLISARGTELCRLYSSVSLALFNDRPF